MALPAHAHTDSPDCYGQMGGEDPFAAAGRWSQRGPAVVSEELGWEWEGSAGATKPPPRIGAVRPPDLCMRLRGASPKS
jgi:hypothetical protein